MLWRDLLRSCGEGVGLASPFILASLRASNMTRKQRLNIARYTEDCWQICVSPTKSHPLRVSVACNKKQIVHLLYWKAISVLHNLSFWGSFSPKNLGLAKQDCSQTAAQNDAVHPNSWTTEYSIFVPLTPVTTQWLYHPQNFPILLAEIAD